MQHELHPFKVWQEKPIKTGQSWSDALSTGRWATQGFF